MNATVTYKCPNCDAGLIFNAEEQGFSCEFCLSHFTKEEIENTASAERAEKKSNGKTPSLRARCESITVPPAVRR